MSVIGAFFISRLATTSKQKLRDEKRNTVGITVLKFRYCCFWGIIANLINVDHFFTDSLNKLNQNPLGTAELHLYAASIAFIFFLLGQFIPFIRTPAWSLFGGILSHHFCDSIWYKFFSVKSDKALFISQGSFDFVLIIMLIIMALSFKDFTKKHLFVLLILWILSFALFVVIISVLKCDLVNICNDLQQYHLIDVGFYALMSVLYPWLGWFKRKVIKETIVIDQEGRQLSKMTSVVSLGEDDEGKLIPTTKTSKIRDIGTVEKN
ncbi:hypothetical protein PCE1_003939 [Barthelona sp. PCE]